MSTGKVSNPNEKKQSWSLEYNKETEKLKKAQTQAQKEAEAKKLVDGLANTVANVYSVDEFVTATAQKLSTHINALNNDDDKNNDLTPEQIALAQKYVESKAFKKYAKADLNNDATLALSKIAGDETKVNATKKGKVKDQVQEELKRQLENKEISKDEYEFLMKKSKTAGNFWSLLGIKRNQKVGTDRIYNVTANTNKKDQREVALTTGEDKDKTAEYEKNFSPELAARLQSRGLDVEKLYEIYNANGAAADATVNYSYKKIQPGEQHAIVTALNQGRKDGEYEFTIGDAKDIAKALGIKWEKAVNPAIVARDAVAGGIVGAPGVAVANSAATAVAGKEIAKATDKAVVPFGAPVGAAIGGGLSAYKQYTRVEDRAIPDDVFIGADSYEQFVKNLDKYSTPEGARLGQNIAKHYVVDGKFLVDQLKADLHHSAGTDNADVTPLNYEEATGLLIDLESGKKVVSGPAVEKTEEVVNIEKRVTIKDNTVPHCEYTIQNGDYPWLLAQDLYSIETPNAKRTADDIRAITKEIQKLVKKDNPNAHFWKVGTTVDLPEIVTVNGKSFRINCGKETTTSLRNNSGTGIVSGSNGHNYETQYDINTDYRPIKMVGNEKQALGDWGNYDKAKGVADNYKKENENENHTVKVDENPILTK